MINDDSSVMNNSTAWTSGPQIVNRLLVPGARAIYALEEGGSPLPVRLSVLNAVMIIITIMEGMT